MQFVLFDVTATLVFLVVYLAVVALRRHVPALAMAANIPSRVPSREPRPTTPPPRREWPRLSYPR